MTARAGQVVAVVAALALSGCAVSPDGDFDMPKGFLSGFQSPGSEGGNAALAQPDAARSLVETVAVAGGDVVVAAPFGYCVDPSTLESGRNGGFVVLASCNILSGGASGASVPPALITVTVGRAERNAVRPDAATLARLADAPLLQMRDEDGLSLAFLGSGGDALFSGGNPRYWRGAFLQGSRLVGLAVYAPAGSGIDGEDGARLLEATFRRIREESPRNATPVSGAPDNGSRG
ncbi:dihydroxy-acid dehydratase [Roseivivax sp. CAU 1753]